MSYSARMPAARITLPIRTVSVLISVASCSGELPKGSSPELKNFCRMSLWPSIRNTSLFSRLIVVIDVFAGANIAVFPTDSYPGTPAAATVGISGTRTDGAALVTAKARNLPDFSCGITAAALGIAICTSPLDLPDLLIQA